MKAAERRTRVGGGHGATPWLALWWAMWVALLGVGCASDFVRRQGPDGPLLEHKELGYLIAEAPPDLPPPLSLRWKRTKVPEADLAYRNDEGSVLSLSSRCRESRASVSILSRQLTIGTSRDRMLTAGPLEHDGDDGWSQTFDTEEGGVTLRIKAVTLLSGVCVYDWLLVAPGEQPFERAEPGFDAWMESFVSPRAAQPRRSGPPPETPNAEAKPFADAMPVEDVSASGATP
jgi:hypothetical protein